MRHRGVISLWCDQSGCQCKCYFSQIHRWRRCESIPGNLPGHSNSKMRNHKKIKWKGDKLCWFLRSGLIWGTRLEALVPHVTTDLDRAMTEKAFLITSGPRQKMWVMTYHWWLLLLSWEGVYQLPITLITWFCRWNPNSQPWKCGEKAQIASCRLRFFLWS